MSRDPTRLQVFHLAHQLTLTAYQLTKRLPTVERLGLAAQLRRAATSIPTNIVEGCSRTSAREYDRFLEIALGSAVEVGYLLRLVADLRMMDRESVGQCEEECDHVVRALQNLRRAVRQFEQ